MIAQPTRRRDVLKWWLQFRDSETGEYVSRFYALLHPKTTQSITRWRR